MTLLFLCTGNTCRSPMAAAIVNHKAKERDLPVFADSAGLSAFENQPATEYAVTALREIGIELSGHLSKPVTPEPLFSADKIYCLTSAHRAALLRVYPQLEEKTFLLGNGIDDPYGLPLSEYRDARDRIETAVLDLLKEFEHDNSEAE